MNKFITSIFLATCLFSSVLLAQSPSWGTDKFVNVGYIGQITNSSIIINDSRYYLSGTTKFSTLGNSEAGIGQAKKGQLVGFKLLVINNRFIVDQMWLIPDNEKSIYGR